MGDIAQILAGTAAGMSSPPTTMFATGPGSSGDTASALQRTGIGMSKEVMDLLVGSNHDPVSAPLPPIFPAFNRPVTASTSTTTTTTTTTPVSKGQNKATSDNDVSDANNNNRQLDRKVKVGTKWISSTKRARPWTWAPFASSSRTDGATFRHWVRAGVEYTDYPYAKFDIHLDPVVYSEEEYRIHLQSDTWTQSETDKLMELARTFELRWPVIHDRWYDVFAHHHDVPVPNSPSGDGVNHNTAIPTTTTTTTKNNTLSSSRRIEDLQHRYYGVAATLAQVRICQEAAKEVQSLAAATTASIAVNATTTTTTSSAKATTSTPTGPSAGVVGTLTETTTNSSSKNTTTTTESTLLETAAARVLATSAGKHQPLIANLGTGSTNKTFDVLLERERRHQLDRMWNRSKEEEAEEMELRRELKLIDAQLRKLKKSGGHVIAGTAAAASGRASIGSGPVGTLAGFTSSSPGSRIHSAASSRNPSRSVSPVPGSTMVGRVAGGIGGFVANPNIADDPTILDHSFTSTAPVPMPQTPYLQSGRLAPPATGGGAGLNKALLKRMDQVLVELNIPPRPLPTKRVCDVYDTVRKDIVTLLTLQKLVLQREGQLQSKRVKLSKLAVSTLGPDDKVLDEERLLGIPPPTPKPPVPTVPTGPAAVAAKAKPTKRKGATGGAATNAKASKKSLSTGPTVSEHTSEAISSKAKADGKGSTTTTTSAATGAVKKKTVKRKRKVETTKNPTPGSVVVKATGSAGGTATAMPGTNPSSVTAGPQTSTSSKKTSSFPPSVATAATSSKATKAAGASGGAVAAATTTTSVIAAANKTEAALSTTSTHKSVGSTHSGDTAKQSTGTAKKRARKS